MPIDTGGFISLPSGSGASSYITVQNSTINATCSSGCTDYVYGGTLNLNGNTWNINSSFFKQDVESGGTINVANGKVFNLLSTANGIFLADDGSPAPALNVYGSKFIGAGGHIIESYGKGIANVHHNLFLNHNGPGVAGWVLVGSTGALNWYNNTHYNSAKAGTALYIQGGGTINSINNVFYNIATPCFGGNCGATGYKSSYNDYFYYTTVTNLGTGSITIDPLFVNAGIDFSLQSASVGAIYTATTTSLHTATTTDFFGNPIYGTPDIGAIEYQPPYLIDTDDIPATGAIRLYAGGKYRERVASTTADTADLAVTPQGGWGSADYREYMDIAVDAWTPTAKSWTATSSIATTTSPLTMCPS